jgi:hypothetical protein
MPNHAKVKNSEWAYECAEDQMGTSKRSYIVIKIKDEFERKIVRNNDKGSDRNDRKSGKQVS